MWLSLRSICTWWPWCSPKRITVFKYQPRTVHPTVMEPTLDRWQPNTLKTLTSSGWSSVIPKEELTSTKQTKFCKRKLKMLLKLDWKSSIVLEKLSNRDKTIKLLQLLNNNSNSCSQLSQTGRISYWHTSPFGLLVLAKLQQVNKLPKFMLGSDPTSTKLESKPNQQELSMEVVLTKRIVMS